MNYGWSYKNIVSDINKLERMAKEEKDIKKKCYYLKVIDYLNATIDESTLSNIDFRKTKNQSMCEIMENVKFYKRYYDLIKKLYIKCGNTVSIRNNLHNETYNMNYIYKPKYITHDKSLAYVYDFYKDIDKELFDCFSKLYNNRYKLVKFSKNDELLSGLMTSGSSISVGGLDKTYITVSNDKGVLKCINLAHEFGHGILNIYNPNLLYNSKDDFSSEIGSIFFELAFNYDIGKSIDSYDSALNNIQELDDRYDICNNLIIHNALASTWENNNYKTDSNFYKILKSEYDLTRQAVDDSLNTSITSEGLYAIGYMAALYLLNIYKKDKESAIKILKEIVNYNNIDSYELINVLMPNIDIYSYEIDDIHNTYSNELKKLIIK